MQGVRGLIYLRAVNSPYGGDTLASRPAAASENEDKDVEEAREEQGE